MNFVNEISKTISNQKVFFIMSFLSLVIFLSNSTYISYPDEFVNILGGKVILHGGVPYKDYYDHHMPLAWYLGSILLFVGQGNFITYRVLWALLQFLILAILGVWIMRNHKTFLNWYGFFLLVIPSFMQYFWLHLYLGDSLAVIFFIPAIFILFLETAEKSSSQVKWFVGPLCVTFMIFSSLSFLYLGLVLILWYMFLYLLSETGNMPFNISRILKLTKSKRFLTILIAFVIPYILYLIYLISSGSLKDFIFANITYNTEHYISLNGFARSSRFNPLRFSLTLIDNFWRAFLPSIGKLAEVSFYQPVSRLVTISIFLSILLFFSSGIVPGILFLLAISFSAPRSNNLTSAGETNYQMGIYLIFGLICAIYGLYSISKNRAVVENKFKFHLKGLVYLWIGVYLFASTVFLLFNSYHIWYARYMGTLPPIVNYSYVAEYIDSLVSKGDYYWIGPFEAHNHFFVKNGKFAGKFPSLLPQFSESDHLKNDFIAEMEKFKPSLIIFKHNMGIFGTPADKFGAFFLDWMKGKYVNCSESKITCPQRLQDYNVMGDVYVRIDRFDIIERLK